MAKETDLQRGKMVLCQRLTGCDGPFLLPCGKKSDNPKYCEEWKKVPLRRKDIRGTGDNMTISVSAVRFCNETLARIKKDFTGVTFKSYTLSPKSQRYIIP